VPAEDAGGDDGSDGIPDYLVETGCVDPDDPTQPASGVIPYDINALFWSDNAVKTRFMALPDGTTIDINGEDDWEYPVGSVLIKNFRLGGRLIETRLLMNRLNLDLGIGQWEGVSYEWDDTETSATRVIGGKTKTIGTQSWTYPSANQCNQCHTDAAAGALGPETAQLNMDYLYPHNAEASNQLEVLDSIGMFTTPLSTPAELLPRLADPFDESASLDARGRAYLHTNCSQCHRPGTGVPSDMDFRYATPLENTNACDALPSQGDIGMGSDARLIAPGSSANSIVLERMSRRDSVGMPPVGSHIHDVDGALLLGMWIDSLESCISSP